MTVSVGRRGEPVVVTDCMSAFLSASDRPFPGFALRFDSKLAWKPIRVRQSAGPCFATVPTRPDSAGG